MKAALLATIVVLPLLAQQDRRIEPIRVAKLQALVIGNSAYKSGPLKNPANDAQDIGAALGRLGFTVTLRTDLTRRGFDEALSQFTRQLGPDDLALFFYSGHGIQVANENYLVPVDYQASSEADVEYEAYAASRVRKKLEETPARIRVLILDACRDNPYRFNRGTGGLAAITSAAEGTLVAFSAGDNQTASDNMQGRNGLYTKYLLAALEKPGLGLREIFEQAQAGVYTASGRKQFPAIYNMIVGSVVLKGGGAAASPLAGQSAKLDAAAEAWSLVRNSDRAEDFDDFVAAFPNSELATTARMRAGQLRRGGAATSRTQPTVSPMSQTAATTAKPGDTRINPKDGLTYAWIPPGTFMMGCTTGDPECYSDEKPAHQVTISKGFWMGQTEVTQEAFKRVTGKSPSTFKGTKLPVEQVTWNDAKSYCEAVGMRLPTEAEWEYAARGGASGARYGKLDEIGWYMSNSENKTHEVGYKQANGFGLNDMLGNVWEWVSDWYGSYPANAASDPQGAASGQYLVLRGGSWGNDAKYIRVSFRFRDAPENRGINIGFRCGGE
jgi:formylglycine-generating enzyme required for sulfatase activity